QPDNLGLQSELVRAIEHGTRERGAALDAGVRAWAEQLTGKMLRSKNAAQVKAGAELVGALRLESYQGQLTALATDASAGQADRVGALSARADRGARKRSATRGKGLGDAAAPVEGREQAATLLARANAPETLAELLRVLPEAPARVQNGIAAGLAGSKAGGE